ncbi:MAG: FAD:protein FMN transferase [Candidatus Nanopelagicales bacterium]
MKSFRTTFSVMGTVASLTGPAGLRTVAPDVEHILRAADDRFSPFRADSELVRMQRDPGRHDPSDDMREVLAGCRVLTDVTDGDFQAVDPRGRVDTTGYVKGWAMQRVADTLNDAGWHDWLLVVGGDVMSAGTNAGRPWRVAIRHPALAAGVADVLELPDGGAVATSADYERGNHVWGNKLGDVSSRTRAGSVTVVGPRIDVADALATALWANGRPRPSWLERVPDYRAFTLDGLGHRIAA